MKINIKSPRETFCFDRFIFKLLCEFDMPYSKRDEISELFKFPLLDHIINKPFEIFNEDVIIVEYHDTWDCCSSLSKIIVPLINRFKTNLNGYPCRLDLDDVPLELRLIKTTEDEPELIKCWEWILDEIVWAFEQKDKDWEEQFYTPNPPINTEYGPGTSYDFDREGHKKYQKRIQNGYRLFGKYLDNIWD